MKKKTKTKRTGSIKYPLDGPNPLIGILDKSFWPKEIVNHNRKRGAFYETIATNLLRSQMHSNGELHELIVDKKVFHCEELKLKRRIDIYIPDLSEAYEIKSSRVNLNKATRLQIKKDHWLKSKGKLKEVYWFLFEGASKATLESLNKHSILYFDFSAEDNKFTNIHFNE